MNVTKFRTFISTFAILILAVIVGFLTPNGIADALPLVYLCATALVIFAASDRSGIHNLFQPSILVGLYASALFLLGTFAYSRDLVVDQMNRGSFFYIHDIVFITSYLLMSIVVTLGAGLFSSKVTLTKMPPFFAWLDKFFYTKVTELYFSALLLFGLGAAYFDLRLTVAGVTFSFENILISVASLYFSYSAWRRRLPARYLRYVIFSLIYIFFLSDDRRLLIFYLVSVGFFESLTFRANIISIRFAAFLILGIPLLLGSVYLMSLLRLPDISLTEVSIPELREASDSIVLDSNFPAIFTGYLEGPALTYHTYDAISRVREDGGYALGSTLYKVFFIPIPRSIFPRKPDSLTEEYNRRYYPDYRAAGGSNAAMFFAEMFWNFGSFGLIALFLIMLAWNRLFKIMDVLVKKRHESLVLLSLLIYFRLLEFARGTGLDSLVWHVLVSIIFLAPLPVILVLTRQRT